ncbi:hypothetical protein [Pontibacter flavimaris]|uniref:O-antigen ligase domain-containing protein n=1 Tax=Pontibacter flavimaris TaxID=1797110 RepID=A0A1Q5PBC3_9BACT|nr:hypothetical protein [Pontibacter flavimaris]OKL39560.1 hypothetical protein A3841_01020 [Pontibacter flavimaris]
MSHFFLLLEISSYMFMIYILLKKGELAIIYLPVIFFSRDVINPVLPATFSYFSMTFMVFYLVFRNPNYLKQNIPAILLFVYFIILLPRSADLEAIRPYIFSVLWLFTLIPLISTIYQKFPREIIFNNLRNTVLLILIIFIANVVISTINRFSPAEMYGITTGILYGNVYAAGFNILTFSIFIIALGTIQQRSIVSLVVLVIAISFLILSLRRSVIGMSFLGVGIAYLTLLTREKAKMFVLTGILICTIGFVLYSATDLADSFKERYELRKLDERELEEESRYLEYELLYKDMFVYYDYSALIGFEPFNSWGNYGRGALEDRSLHGDLTSITHSSGLIGLFLYLLMVFTAFRSAWRASETRTDLFIVLFCAISFIAYTLTGRYTEVGSMMMLYLILALPLARREQQPDEELAEQEAALIAS